MLERAFNGSVSLLILPALLAAAASMAAVSLPAPANTVPLTACAAVARQDIEAALGRSVAAGVEDNRATLSTCQWTGGMGIVTVAIHRLREPANLGAQQQDLKTVFPSASFRRVNTGGASGFFMDLPKAGTQLHLMQSTSHYIQVTILGFGAAADVAPAAESIAHKILRTVCGSAAPAL